MSLFYWAWLGIIVYILFRKGPMDVETVTFGDFLQDAFVEKTQGRSEAQEFVYAVYGGAGTAKWKSWAYLISASVAYVLLFSFLCAVIARVLWQLPFYFSDALFLTGYAFLVSALLLAWMHSKTRGNQKKKAADRTWTSEPNSTKTLPWWWIYQTTPVGFLARLSVTIRKAMRFYLAVCVVLFGALEFVLKAEPHVSGNIWILVVPVLFLVLWILTGAILPLDALVQVGDWRGGGVFSEVIAADEVTFRNKA